MWRPYRESFACLCPAEWLGYIFLSQAYVKERVLRFASEPTFHKLLGVSPAVVDEAVRATIAERTQRAAALQTGGRFLQLVYRHDCQ